MTGARGQASAPVSTDYIDLAERATSGLAQVAENSAQIARGPRAHCPMLFPQEVAFCACLLFCPPGTWTLLGALHLGRSQGCRAWLGVCFPSPLSSQGAKHCSEGLSDMILFNMHTSCSTDWKLG